MGRTGNPTDPAFGRPGDPARPVWWALRVARCSTRAADLMGIRKGFGRAVPDATVPFGSGTRPDYLPGPESETSSRMHHPPREFRSALSQAETAANALSGAIRAVLDPMLPGSSGARSCGRALGLERTLGWKLWTIAHTSDLATTLKVLPGRRGWTQVAAALAKRGGDPAAIAAMRDAAERLHELLSALKRSPALLRAIA